MWLGMTAMYGRNTIAAERTKNSSKINYLQHWIPRFSIMLDVILIHVNIQSARSGMNWLQKHEVEQRANYGIKIPTASNKRSELPPNYRSSPSPSINGIQDEQTKKTKFQRSTNIHTRVSILCTCIRIEWFDELERDTIAWPSTFLFKSLNPSKCLGGSRQYRAFSDNANAISTQSC